MLKNKSNLKVSQIENYLKASEIIDSKEKTVENQKTKSLGKLLLYSGLSKKRGNSCVNV